MKKREKKTVHVVRKQSVVLLKMIFCKCVFLRFFRSVSGTLAVETYLVSDIKKKKSGN